MSCCCGKPNVTFQWLPLDSSFLARKKFSSGMTAEITFPVYRAANGVLEVEPSFVIYRKRNQAWKIPNEITGQDGMAPLVWAKEMLDAFEEYLFFYFRRDKTAQIFISWSNKKRGNAYKAVLKKHGYILVYEESAFFLKKSIKRPEEYSYCFR